MDREVARPLARARDQPDPWHMTPPTATIVQVRELKTAEELFHELSPVSGEMWKVAGNHDWEPDWIFRGQSNSANGTIWTLKPTAFRPDAFTPYAIAAINVPPPPTGLEQRKRELELAMRFATNVDQHGVARRS